LLYARSSRVAAPLLAFSLLTCWLSTKSLIQSLRTIRKCCRIESPVQVGADGGRKFAVKDVSWTSEIMSDQRRSSRHSPWRFVRSQELVSNEGINALQDHTPSSFVHPLPVPLLAQGGRLAGRSSVSPQVAGPCKGAATALERREKAQALGTGKRHVAGTQIALVLRLRLVC
jgi:hypothetical protein